MEVLLFSTCLGDLVAPDSVTDAALVLAAAGFTVVPVRGATCCGQPGFNSGFESEARRVARRTLRAIPDGDTPIIVPAGSCAAMMARHWPHLFRGDRGETQAKAIAARVVEFSQFVARHADRLPPLATKRKVGYHDSCHMLRELRIKDEPRALLNQIEGVETVELRSADRCCGFGGTFSVRYPDVSLAMVDSKLADVASADVDLLVSCDGGCLMQLGGRMSRQGAKASPMHLATLLAEAIDGAR